MNVKETDTEVMYVIKDVDAKFNKKAKTEISFKNVGMKMKSYVKIQKKRKIFN